LTGGIMTASGGADRIKTVIEKTIDSITVFLFIIIFIAAVSQVFMRWIVGKPLVWSEELIRLLYVWVSFLGWVISTRSGSHIRITMVISRLPPGFQKVMETINCILVIGFSVFLIWYGFRLAYIGRTNKAISIPVNFAMVYAIVPVSNFLIILYKILDILNLWRKKEQAS
jgi:TRAP-type C4-dicarboxylate transport system permease small subunit